MIVNSIHLKIIYEFTLMSNEKIKSNTLAVTLYWCDLEYNPVETPVPILIS